MRFLIIAATALLVSCRDASGPALIDAKTGLPHTVLFAISGTWNLQTVAGQALPWTIGQGTDSRTEFVSSTLVINANGNYTRDLRQRTTYTDGRVVDFGGPVAGTFTGSVDTGPITLRFNGGNGAGTVSFTGTVNGNALTLSGFAEPHVYVRP